MSKKIHKDLSAVVKPHLDRAKTVQIPFTAHTSTNAKAGIFAALSLATLAFAGVAALVGHKVASRVSPEYREFSHKHLDKLVSCCGGNCKDCDGCCGGNCKLKDDIAKSDASKPAAVKVTKKP